MGVRDKDMKKRANELEIGKRAMYGMPFYGKYAPCGATKQFDQTFSNLVRSSLIKLSQSLMHGANPWRGEEMKKRVAPRRGAI